MPKISAGNIRKMLTVNGNQWRVRFVRNLAHPVKGPVRRLCDPDTRTIYIEWLQAPDEKWRAFFPELFYVSVFEAGLDGMFIPSEFDKLAAAHTENLMSLFAIEWRTARKRKEKPKPQRDSAPYIPKLSGDLAQYLTEEDLANV